jgi:hypothetical protein
MYGATMVFCRSERARPAHDESAVPEFAALAQAWVASITIPPADAAKLNAATRAGRKMTCNLRFSQPGSSGASRPPACAPVAADCGRADITTYRPRGAVAAGTAPARKQRHDPVPDTPASARVLSFHADGGWGDANTIIVPACHARPAGTGRLAGPDRI